MLALLLRASIIDIQTRTIPNAFVIALAGLWIMWQLALCVIAASGIGGAAGAGVNGVGITSDAMPIISHAGSTLIGAFLFAACLLVFVVVCERISGKYLFGGGDIKLLVTLTLYLGVNKMLVGLFVACLVSLIYAFIQRLQTIFARTPSAVSVILADAISVTKPISIPFAPCLTCGTFLALLM